MKWRSFKAGIALACLAAAQLVTVVATPEVAKAVEPCPASAWDAADALAAAVACGGNVEVESLRGESTQTSATPTGEFAWRQSFSPERVRRTDGSWTATDATLSVDADGAITPTASTVDMWFPTVGEDPTVLTRFGDAEFALTLEGVDQPLPAPQIAGATATYPEVMTGIDLALTAEVDGFSHVLVVKNAEAAANPAVQSATFSYRADGVSVRKVSGDLIEVVDPATDAVLMSTGSAVMWDSGTAGASRSGLGARDAGETGSKSAPLGVEVAGGSVTLRADTDFLSDPSTVYPVYIDPSWTSKESKYATLTDRQGSYYDQPHPPVDGAQGKLKVGYTSEYEVFAARSLLKMPLASKVQGTHVSKAIFSITQGWSWNIGDPANGCKGGTATGLYKVPAFDGGIKWSTGWNSSGSGWQDRLSGNSELRRFNHAECSAAKVEWTATSAVRSAVSRENKYVYLGLKADDEGTTSGWKKYRLDAELLIYYNTPPQKPAGVKVNDKDCASGTSRPFIGDGTPGDGKGPKVTGTIDDVDLTTSATPLSAKVWWKPLSGDWTTGPQITQSGLGKDGPVHVYLPETLADGTYSFKVGAHDGSLDGKSRSCEFTLDRVRPGQPGVTQGAGATGGIGETREFKITKPVDVDVTGYRVCAGDPNCDGRDIAMNPDGTASAYVTPLSASLTKVYVWAVDKAGNISADPKIHEFNVSETYTPQVGSWTFEERSGSNVVGTVGPNLEPLGAPAIVSGRAAVDAAARFTSADGYHTPIGVAPVVDTSKSFSMSAWARLDSDTTQQTVLSVAGTNRTAVQISYIASTKLWVVTTPETDTSAATSWHYVYSKVAPTLGTWTHLTATYDLATSTLEFYVNGVSQGKKVRPAMFKANGPIWVGRAGIGTGAGVTPILGTVDEVNVWNRVITNAEIRSIGAVPMQTGHWKLDNEGTGSSSDDSTFDNQLSLGTGSQFTDGGTALRMAEGSACPATSRQILHTTSSFSVAAWVKLADGSQDRYVLTQSGVNRPGFALAYQAATGRWQFTMPVADAASTTFDTVSSDSPAQLNSWTHLAATYDAYTGQMRLFVNGIAAKTTATNAIAWNATGVLRAGCATVSGATIGGWVGDLDDVQVFAGILNEKADSPWTPSISSVMRKAGRAPDRLPDRSSTDRLILIDFDGGGNASLSTLVRDEYTGTWAEQLLWLSPTSDYYPATTTIEPGDFNRDGYTDVIVLHESRTVDKHPGWTHSVISSRTVTMTVLLGEEYGLAPGQVRDHGTTNGTPENPTAPPGPWAPSITALAAGDIDGDDDDDLVVTADGRNCTGGPRVFTAANGTLSDPAASPAGAIDWCLLSTAQPVLTDMNGDGAEDLAVFATAASGVGGRLGVHRAIGNGTLAAPTLEWSSTSAAWNAANLAGLAADINGAADDPRLDPVTGLPGAGYGDLAVTRTNTATSTWVLDAFTTTPGTTDVTGPVTKATPATPTAAAKATGAMTDVDHDGDSDLLVVYRDDTGATAWLYTNNAGTFGAEQLVWTRAIPSV